MVGKLALVGLTGGIGSGKSTVARLVAARGVPVLDADVIAREVTEPGAPAYAELVAAFPHVVGRDGRIDRRALAAHVFADAEARRRLERIMHPRIQERALAHARRLDAAGERLAFYEASLLVETGRAREYDALVVVTAPEAVRIARAVARDGRSEAEVRARAAAQLPEEAKLRAATHVIDNAGDLAATERQVDELLGVLRRRFASS
jgi:dephospho-CoA kinase